MRRIKRRIVMPNLGIQKEIKKQWKASSRFHLRRERLRPSRRKLKKAGLGFGNFYNVRY